MSFAFRVAKRFLKSDKKQTALIILGIAIGISVQIFVGLLIDSLQISLVDSTVGNSAHITIQSNETLGVVEDPDEIVDDIEGIEDIKYITKNLQNISYIMNFSSSGTQILVKGFELEGANQIYNYYNDDFEGSKPTDTNEVIIGRDLAEKYQISIGDTLETKKTPNPILDSWEVEVAGIFDLGVASLNELWVITNNETYRDLYTPGDVANSIVIQVDKVFDADLVAQTVNTSISRDLGGLEIIDWKEQNESLLSGLQGQTISSVFIQAFVLISVVIAIASILAITVLQKSKQVGILKAMGTDDVKASRIFLYEGFLLGLGGTILGVSLGVLMLWAFGTFATDTNGNPIIDITLDFQFIGLSAVIAIVSSLLAGFIPARKSKKLNIIDIIREG